MQALGITTKDISIRDACIQHMEDALLHDQLERKDITYENL